MDSSLFCWLSLRPPIFNSSLFTSFGFFTLRSSLFTKILHSSLKFFTLHFFLHIFLYFAKKTAKVSLVFDIKVLSLLHTKI